MLFIIFKYTISHILFQTRDELEMFNSVVESFVLNYESASRMSKLVKTFRQAVEDFSGYDVVGTTEHYQVGNVPLTNVQDPVYTPIHNYNTIHCNIVDFQH